MTKATTLTIVLPGALAMLLVLVAPGCSGPESGRRSPVSPSAVPPSAVMIGRAPAPARAQAPPAVNAHFAFDARSGTGIALLGDRPGLFEPTDIVFPPRSEPLQFRTALEDKYRTGLRRPSVQTYVDQEGTVVWVQEYLRYRVNLCGHADAVSRVMAQIDGRGIQPTCGTATTATFPPRNEPLDFMNQLEAKYRDGLRRPTSASFVDVEGNVIWTQEYMRYRVSGCSHSDAQSKVFSQIDGFGVASDCRPPNLVFRFVANACACVRGQIEIRTGNTVLGFMGCSETKSFEVPPGTYTVSACGTNGCFGGSNLGTFSTSFTRNLVC